MMIRYFCIGFIDFMSKGRSLLEYTNLFSPNEYKKNGNQSKYVKMYCTVCNKYRIFEKKKNQIFLKEH